MIAVAATGIVVIRNKKVGAPGGTTSTQQPTVQMPQTSTAPKPTSVAYKIEEVTSGLTVPWAIVFTSKDRMLVTERAGAIRVVQNGKLEDEPLARFIETVSQPGNETGLMGLAADPNFSENHALYACLTYTKNGQMTNKIVRFIDEQGAPNRTVILDDVPAARYHVGCRLSFGPDKKLYATFGDATEGSTAQDPTSKAGKIMRMNTDGGVPEDNPFNGSLTWSYGHRNPQGIAWQPGTNQMYESEHGPSGGDGPRGGDEVNKIEKGGNYGWPTISYNQTRDGMIGPVRLYESPIAPAAVMFYSSDVLPQFTGDFFIAALYGQGIYRYEFDKSDQSKITFTEKMPDVNVGRVREITQSQDGSIYFTTSNADGRGNAAAGEDRIYRIAPQ